MAASAVPAEDFDRFFERAVRLDVLSEAALDTLTDHIAEGSVSAVELMAEYAPRVAAAGLAAMEALQLEEEDVTPGRTPRGEGREAELAADLAALGVNEESAYNEGDDHAYDDLDESIWEIDDPSRAYDGQLDDDPDDDDGEAGTIGIVIDLHYLQVAASSFSLTTAWSVPAFEQALVRSCGGGSVSVRIACDSCQYDASRRGSPDEPGSPDGPSRQSKEAYGKARLHAALKEAGYRLVLSPNKAISNAQGATDVDVACSVFEVAGAFAPGARAQTLALVAGDADFKPVVSAVLAARGHELRVTVIAEQALLSHKYL